MKLVLIRHAPAEERTLSGREFTRPLTPDGRRRMRRSAKGLRALTPEITLLVTSPLVRARQTAEIVAGQYEMVNLITLSALSPGESPRMLLAWLKQQAPEATIAAVGHEPGLGLVASWLLARRKESFLSFKKGAACLIDFIDEPAAGAGVLVWMLSPPILRELGR
ncbi:MAG: SixA phosphatase family protein [Acidiferrobacterales bacterium]